MKIAVCQFTASMDVDANLQKCVELIERSAAAGADLAVLPEESMYHDPHGEGTRGGYSEDLDGPFASTIATAARTAGVTVVLGITETLRGDPRKSNTLLAVSAMGSMIGQYRKLHLYDAFGYRESDRIRPGDIAEPLLFEVNGVLVGALTCYDLRFPEAFRWVADAGAAVIAVPAAWAAGPSKVDHWTTLLKARAIENTIYVAAAGQTPPVSCGESMVVDPMGVILCSAGQAPGLALAEVTTERVAAVRAVNPSLSMRRFATVPR
jgi:predicted amidohydrolase